MLVLVSVGLGGKECVRFRRILLSSPLESSLERKTIRQLPKFGKPLNRMQFVQFAVRWDAFICQHTHTHTHAHGHAEMAHFNSGLRNDFTRLPYTVNEYMRSVAIKCSSTELFIMRNAKEMSVARHNAIAVPCITHMYGWPGWPMARTHRSQLIHVQALRHYIII